MTGRRFWLAPPPPFRSITPAAAMPNIVYFDLETQKSADEVGGWNHIRDMRMSVGVTYSTARGGYAIYGERRVQELIAELQRADLVVGFNLLRFDYTVLEGYHALFHGESLPTLDLMVDLAGRLGFRPSLDAVASATFGAEKTADGLQAIRWFREGRLAEIAEYCCYDVKLTRLVHEFGRDRRQVFINNRLGQLQSVPVAWR